MPDNRAQTLLPNLLVVELGQRLSAGLCGSLLAELGTDVIAVELTSEVTHSLGKPIDRSLNVGKRSLHADLDASADVELLADLIVRADVVLVSADADPAWPEHITTALKETDAIVADVTAFGADGPMQGRPYSDVMIQAMSGIMHTNGEQGQAPGWCRAPIVEASAALYTCAGILAALRVRGSQGIVQKVSVAAFDCAIGMLATFLPKYFAGQNVIPIGNHHPGMSPWNAYRAKDGWVLICAGTDDQWRRLCKLLGKTHLIDRPAFKTNSDRVKNSREIDVEIEDWTGKFSIQECLHDLNKIGISAGPILTMATMPLEPNIAHHRMISEVRSGDRVLRSPGSVFRGSLAQGRTSDRLPAANEDRAFCEGLRQRPKRNAAKKSERRPALEGIRVLEMGQFTTAPLVGRHLGSLGADVVKLEPEGGDPSRHMPPQRDDQSYFFSLSNSEKRVMTLDLRQPGRDRLLSEFIAGADVLVENTKPGTLPRHGFTPEAILSINPRIVYCDISGFSSGSPSAGLGAMDTTIQGLAGIMDLTRSAGAPYKTGISVADLLAGQFALVAVLAALDFRERTGRGQYIEIAMLNAAAWVTRTQWNDAGQTSEDYRVLTCSDGYVLANDGGSPADAVKPGMTRKEAVDAIRDAHGSAVAVQTVSEAADHPQTKARRLIIEGATKAGRHWPLLASPIGLSETPPSVSRVPGAADSDAVEIFAAWDLHWTPEATPALRINKQAIG